MTRCYPLETQVPAAREEQGVSGPPKAVQRPDTARQTEGGSAAADDRFEETYPHYPFAELVRLGLCIGALIARWRRKQRSRRPKAMPADRGERRAH